jgi:hypothetical protein
MNVNINGENIFKYIIILQYIIYEGLFGYIDGTIWNTKIFGQYKFPQFTNTTFTASYQEMILCKMEEL